MGRMESRYIGVDGIRIRYCDNSRSRVQSLLFVHGLGGSIESWTNNLKPLSEKFRVIAIDLPGFGLSDKPLMDYTIGFYCSILLKFVRELKLRRPINIVGSSLGGQIAANIAISNLIAIRKLILICPAGVSPKSFTSSPGLVSYANIITATSPIQIKKWMSLSSSIPIRDKYAALMFQRIRMPGARAAFQSALRHSADAKRIDTGEINSHTLVIWGKDDLVIPVKFISPFITMKNCRVYIIEKCGHRPHAEKPATVNAMIQSFIQGT